MVTEEAVDDLKIETVVHVVVVVVMMVGDRVEAIKGVVAVEAVEITFLNEMEIGHAVGVQIKISHGEMNVIGKLNVLR